MKLTTLALVLFLVMGTLLGTLMLLNPRDADEQAAVPIQESSKENWNRPNEEHPDQFPHVDDFFRLLLYESNPTAAENALKEIEKYWQPGNAIMVIEMMVWLRETNLQPKLQKLLVDRLPVDEYNRDKILSIIWSEDVKPHPQYPLLKKRLYSQSSLDERFAEYFDASYESLIRLDEVRWGGVRRDGIPPLVDPEMISVQDADYLADDNVVFGIEINGDSRAYPKRILAWHEMFRATVGGEPVAGVYCTLCGSLIIYKTTKPGANADDESTQYTLGTSGMLYRSNKLMYDHETKSLWSTMKGQPVVGPLVGKGIELPRHSVVTTTWGQWKSDHPDTTVLSLNTGHKRDYREGKAYEKYFSHDKLMFQVPISDGRLRNKEEVLALRSGDETLAIADRYLKKNAIHHDTLAGKSLVVLTDASNANRVFDSAEVKFTSYDGQTVTDEQGQQWSVSESELKLGERILPRMAAHRAFWFGWINAFPDTRLVK